MTCIAHLDILSVRLSDDTKVPCFQIGSWISCIYDKAFKHLIDTRQRYVAHRLESDEQDDLSVEKK